MRLKYPAYYRRAPLYWMLSAALLTAFGFAIYLIFVESGFDAVPSDARSSAYVSLFFILICALYLALRGPFLFSARRKLRRVSRNSTPQSIFSGSWSSEEVITLGQTYPRHLGLIVLLFGVAAFFTLGTPAITSVVPVFVEIVLDPSRLMSQNVVGRETIASLLPLTLLLIAFSLLARGMTSYLAATNKRITADERGITVAGRRRSRHIAWNEIVLFVRLMQAEYPAVAGSYALLGSRKFITFNISDVQARNSKEDIRSMRRMRAG